MSKDIKKDVKPVEMLYSKETKIDEFFMDLAHTFGFPIHIEHVTFKGDKVIVVFKSLAPPESRPRDMQ